MLHGIACFVSEDLQLIEDSNAELAVSQSPHKMVRLPFLMAPEKFALDHDSPVRALVCAACGQAEGFSRSLDNARRLSFHVAL